MRKHEDLDPLVHSQATSVKLFRMVSLPPFRDFLQSLEQPIHPTASPQAAATGEKRCLAMPQLSDKAPPTTSNTNWFDPTSRYAQVVQRRIQHLSTDELYAEFWRSDPDRPRYGVEAWKKEPTIPKPPKRQPSDWSKQDYSRKWRDYHHSQLEKERRDRHRVIQRTAHEMTCELANELAEHDGTAIPERRGPFKPPPKKPGKDQQLCANIYMQVLSARVVQSEHRSRKLAERQIHLLKAALHDQLDSKLGTIRETDDEDQVLTSVG